MKFIDLRIEFEPADGNHSKACVSSAPDIGPPCEVDFVLPFTPDHLARLLDRINQNVTRGGGRRMQVYRTGRSPNVRYLSQQQLRTQLVSVQDQADGPLDLTEALGRDLFAALLGGADSRAYSIYCRSRRLAIQRRQGLRIWLLLPSDDTMDRVPFEYLFDPWEEECLAKCPDISIVRGVPVQCEPREILPGELCLMYITATPISYGRVNDFSIISDAYVDAGLKVATYPVFNATVDKLSNCMESYADDSPQIVHFSTHGRCGEVLLLGSTGQAHFVPVADLGVRLAHAKKLRLVMFNVCDNDRPVKCTRELCRRGVAVVTMQFLITAGSRNPSLTRPCAAKFFQKGFYRSYFGDFDLDRAVAAGRNEIAINIGDTMEWGTPVLVVPEFRPVPWYTCVWRRVCSFLATRTRTKRGILVSVGLVLAIIFSLMIYLLVRTDPPPPTIEWVDVYTSDVVFTMPGDGHSFPVVIKGEGGTVPIEILATSQNWPLDFTYTVLHGEGLLEKKNQVEPKAQFEYKPSYASSIDVLEFCVHKKGQETVKSCTTIVLDIIMLH